MKRIALIIGMSAIMFAVVVSCKKDNNETTVQNSLAKDIVEAEAGTDGKYIYILNEGVWGGNDASLDRIEVASERCFCQTERSRTWRRGQRHTNLRLQDVHCGEQL